MIVITGGCSVLATFYSGLYTVKSGYNLLCESSSRDAASSSNTAGTKKFWSNLWKLKVPNKVKSFLWRACTNSIPTMQNFLKQKVTQSYICSFCKVREEFTIHALWSCEKLQPIWNSCFSTLPSEFSRIHYFSDLVMLVFSSHINSEVFVMTCWAIWNKRNTVRVGEVV